MSRHRYVRNLDLDSELQQDVVSSDEDNGPIGPEIYREITPTQKVQLSSGLAHVRSIIGTAQETTIRDREIREALWDSFFDVEGTVDWFLNGKAAEAKEKEKEKEKAAAKRKAGTSTPKKNNKPSIPSSSKTLRPIPGAPPPTPKAPKTKTKTPPETSTPPLSAANTALAGLNLDERDLGGPSVEVLQQEEVPKMTIAKEKVLEEARKAVIKEDGRKAVSVVVIGHVDAGKSTLMGRLLYELGQIEENNRLATERASGKAGASGSNWAWEMDGLTEERERGVTMDISQTVLPLPTTDLTILDAPGHRDFIPNMISGASQADAALLVLDASTGEFESGFEGGGQSREHVLLVRSLGVANLVVAVNKLDMVSWSQNRYDEICTIVRPFLVQSGFSPSRISFVPCAAMAGVNLTSNSNLELAEWYTGPTLAEELDKLQPPARAIDAPLRIPISNVFRGIGGGASMGNGISGRLCSGVVQVGETLRVLPGDETATVRVIELDNESVPWAAAGSHVTLYLSNIDPVNLSIGGVLCPISDLVPLVSAFTAQIIVFDIKLPITVGASVELFHHSRENPATISKLVAILDKANGAVIKSNPRVLGKNSSATVQVKLRGGTISAPSQKNVSIPLEPFSVNKEMGRILIRRGGETIAAGIVTEIFS